MSTLVILKDLSNLHIKEIKELKFHRNISYGINITFVIAIVLIVIIIIKLRKNVTVVSRTEIKNVSKTEDLELANIRRKYAQR